MRSHAGTYLLGATLVLGLSACGSSSPKSIDDLSEVIESAGYECENPTDEGDDREGVSCGEEIYATWYPSASDEAASFEAASSVYEGVPTAYSVDLHMIRGQQWRISGDEGAVTKVAESLGKDVVSIGN
ncbi:MULTISPECIES: hypothetical protein [unclassified Arthrobacter]|uniref:hypothetical protein n=1 Tax=unclassified Arthrobacter TaxID=235627 RepID=UPI001E4E8D93|nr:MULTISPECIES: hypothetical protein [unclassified Arthrobacter]MCC9145926.1 hypothetical protein [Arthrobacter sp. zg-Y919]MDK1277155.1 hypothetical protein [Arthrobacter sp. zg.Y919]WIB03672.1 hypothetical protein QNO10_03045 [Arthrobacter sp. zg-Y919]